MHSGDFMARHRFKIKFIIQACVMLYVLVMSILLAAQVRPSKTYPAVETQPLA